MWDKYCSKRHCRVRFEFPSILIEIIALIGLFWYAHSASVQADANKAAADAATTQAVAALTSAKTAQKQLELSERPWISVKSSIISPLTFDALGARITLKIVLQNWGHTPATHVYIWASFVAPEGLDPFGPLKEQRQMCEAMQRNRATRSASAMVLGRTIFPSDHSESTEGFQMGPDEILKGLKLKGFPNKTSRFIFPQIVGCALYQFGNFNNIAYRTDFRYELFRRALDNPNVALGVVPKDSVLPSDLLAIESDTGNDTY